MSAAAEPGEIARRALEQLDAAFAAPSAEAFERCFDPGVIFVGSADGEQATGLDELLALVGSLAADLGPATFAIDWDRVEAVNGDGIVYVAGSGTLRATGSLASVDGTGYRLTGVLVPSPGGWRWRLYHGSEPGRPPAP